MEKQSSVEILIEKLKVCASSNFDYSVPHTEILIPTQVLELLFEQAKVMHEKEITVAHYQGANYESDSHGAMYTDLKDSQQYYNETYEQK